MIRVERIVVIICRDLGSGAERVLRVVVRDSEGQQGLDTKPIVPPSPSFFPRILAPLRASPLRTEKCAECQDCGVLPRDNTALVKCAETCQFCTGILLGDASSPRCRVSV